MPRTDVFPLTLIPALGLSVESNGDVLSIHGDRFDKFDASLCRFNSGKRAVTFERGDRVLATIAFKDLAELELFLFAEPLIGDRRAHFSLVLRDGQRIILCEGAREDVERLRSTVVDFLKLPLPANAESPDWTPPPASETEAILRAATHEGPVPAPLESPRRPSPWRELRRREWTLTGVALTSFGGIFFGYVERTPTGVLIMAGSIAAAAIAYLRWANWKCPRCGNPFRADRSEGPTRTDRCQHCDLPRDSAL